MKHKAKSTDFKWSEPEDFALQVETVTDWAKIKADQTRAEVERRASEGRQLDLTGLKNELGDS